MSFLKDAVFILENACFCCDCSILPTHMDELPFIKLILSSFLPAFLSIIIARKGEKERSHQFSKSGNKSTKNYDAWITICPRLLCFVPSHTQLPVAGVAGGATGHLSAGTRSKPSKVPNGAWCRPSSWLV
ncbi:hypothetical protein CKAN_01413200 [Cinnamomum micranthum f. kanehirae]|uniref:Uncharacterized protein n=1 Tax=Cinnamomum micranthum f. kanehirae TaxID=337451 RepID=A0A3S3MKC8_9MAGN|nr:hypothetical protein CKAN_01413200 [Cinnamomum micranthum f. kanehirae]